MRSSLIHLVIVLSLSLPSLRATEPASLPFETLKFTALDGREIDITKLRGKVVLVDFWATWCGPCIRELFGLQPIYRKYHASGFEIIGVYCDTGSASQLDTFLKKYGMTWPQFFGGELKDRASVAQRFGVTELPTTFLIGRDGTLIGQNIRGAAFEPALREALGLAPEAPTPVKR